jgi:hypothetical protein
MTLALCGALCAGVATLASCARSAGADALPPQIHTVAGGGSCLWPAQLQTGLGTIPCSSVFATAVPIYLARAVAALPKGGYLYVNFYSDLVQEVSPSPLVDVQGTVPQPGIVNTVAGDGTTQDAPDGSSSVYSGLDGPVAVAPLPDGGFVITEYDSSVLREVSPGAPGQQTITTIAGTGKPGDNGVTAGPATSVQLDYPGDAEVNPDGSIVIADTGNGLIRLLTPNASGGYDASVIAGGGSCDDATSSCDGMPATSVELHDPVSVSPISGQPGAYLLAEGAPGDDTVREISPTGTFSTVAGRLGPAGFSGDGGPATAAQLNDPSQVVSTAGGGFLIADTDNERIRSVSPSGTITTIAGDGTAGYQGDDGDATAASLETPMGISPTADGGFLIADANNNVIRQVTIPPTTTISVQKTGLGLNGWYIDPVPVTVTVTDGAVSNCELDPLTPPPAFAAMLPGCQLSGSNITLNGKHTIWAASENSFDDVDLPVSLSFKVDLTPPTVTCVGTPTFRFGALHAIVTAKVHDSVSGPQRPIVSTTADTSRIGERTATLRGEDRAGLTNFVRCDYAVLPIQLQPLPRLKSSFQTSTTTTTVRRLDVDGVPAGASINVSCTGNGCPFSEATGVSGRRCGCRPCGQRVPPRHEYGASLAPLLAGAALAAHATVTVSVTETGRIGHAWRFTFEAHRRPAEREYCLASGSLTAVGGCRT